MDSHSEIQTLLPSPDEVQQAQGTVGKGHQRVVTGLSWPYIKSLGRWGTIRMTAQWSEASKVSEKQGLLSQMLRDLLGDIKTGSERTGEDEFDDKHPPGMVHTRTGVYQKVHMLYAKCRQKLLAPRQILALGINPLSHYSREARKLDIPHLQRKVII